MSDINPTADPLAPFRRRRVILVAPEFPPSNTAGAHRPRLFARHLPAFGWTPTVLTIRPDQIEGPLDSLLERLVPDDLDVVRTGALPVRPIRFVGDFGIRSLPYHARALFAMTRSGEIDAIVLFGPPWFSFVLGPVMRRWRGLPYVLDYIDPWISDWTAAHAFPSKGWFYHRAAAAIEPAVLRSAAHVTAVSAGMLQDLQARYPWLDSGRLSSMPYGAEPDDLEASARLGQRPPDFSPDDGNVTVCFTGALQPKGGELLRAILLAVRAVRDSGSPLGRHLKLRFYGTSNLTWGHGRYAAIPVARELGLDEDAVSEIPERIPYLQAMAVLRACSVVLVMGSSDPAYDASKLYPAVLSGRPVLAVCHAESSMRTVIEDTGAGLVVTFANASEIGQRVGDIVRALEDLAVRPGRHVASAAALERFTARASTSVLASALQDITARRAPEPEWS